jgi:hypothetical protein
MISGGLLIYFSETRQAGKRYLSAPILAQTRLAIFLFYHPLQPHVPHCVSFPFLLATCLSVFCLCGVNFEKELLPFLTKKCIDCHKAPYEENGKKKEPKAGLRLDASWAIVKGSENGPVLTAGAPDKSASTNRSCCRKTTTATCRPKAMT